MALLFGCATNVLAQSKSIEYFNCSGKAEFFNEKNLISSTNVAYDFAINSTDYELLAKGDIAFSFSGAITKADCESRFQEFTEIYQCTYDSIVAKNPKILKDPMAKLYMLRGEQLAVAVTRQQMSSLDAKVEWQKQFLEMKRMKEQEVGLALQAISAMPQPQPQYVQPQVNMPRVGPSAICTSNKIGSTVYTNCQ